MLKNFILDEYQIKSNLNPKDRLDLVKDAFSQGSFSESSAVYIEKQVQPELEIAIECLGKGKGDLECFKSLMLIKDFQILLHESILGGGTGALTTEALMEEINKLEDSLKT
jgi:hypothetical protein